MIVARDFNFPVRVLQDSGWMRLQLHVLQPEIDVPTFVTKNGVSSNDFVLFPVCCCQGARIRLSSSNPVCMGTDLCVSILRIAGQCRGSGRWSEVQQYNFSESTRASRSLQNLPPSMKDCRLQRKLNLVRGMKKP